MFSWEGLLNLNGLRGKVEFYKISNILKLNSGFLKKRVFKFDLFPTKRNCPLIN